jgi:hypothetical protein
MGALDRALALVPRTNSPHLNRLPGTHSYALTAACACVSPQRERLTEEDVGRGAWEIRAGGRMKGLQFFEPNSRIYCYFPALA